MTLAIWQWVTEAILVWLWLIDRLPGLDEGYNSTNLPNPRDLETVYREVQRTCDKIDSIWAQLFEHDRRTFRLWADRFRRLCRFYCAVDLICGERRCIVSSLSYIAFFWSVWCELPVELICTLRVVSERVFCEGNRNFVHFLLCAGQAFNRFLQPGAKLLFSKWDLHFSLGMLVEQLRSDF